MSNMHKMVAKVYRMMLDPGHISCDTNLSKMYVALLESHFERLRQIKDERKHQKNIRKSINQKA
jgi:hypothetical protein